MATIEHDTMEEINRLRGAYAGARRRFDERRAHWVRELGGDLNALAANDEAMAELKRLGTELDAAGQALMDATGLPEPDTNPLAPLPRLRGGRSLGGGKAADGSRSLGDVFIRNMTAAGSKALDGTSGSTLVPSAWDPALVDLPAGTVFVQSLIPRRAVGSDKIGYIAQTVRTNNAAPVARLAAKPVSVLTVERREAEVATVATVTEAIDRMLLLDHDQLRGFLDNQLRLMILQAVEDEVVNGSGTPPHMRGIMNTPGIGSAGPPGTGETAADAIYAGITALRQEFLEADGIVLNPQDWQTIRLLKTTTDEYLAGSVISDDPPTLWGKRVVATSVLAPGTGLVGAFGQGAVIFDREQTRVAFAETGAGDTEGSELFTTNAIRFRAESRLAFAVTRPSAFVEVDLAA